MKPIRSAEEWAAVRAQGKTQYVVRNGVLGRGLPLGTLVAVAIELALKSPFPEFLSAPIFWVRFVGLVAVLSASGCLNARTSWDFYEKRFGPGAVSPPRPAR